MSLPTPFSLDSGREQVFFISPLITTVDVDVHNIGPVLEGSTPKERKHYRRAAYQSAKGFFHDHSRSRIRKM